MSNADLGASNVQVNTRRHKALAAGDGLLRHSVPGETLLYKVTGDDTDGALDIFLLSIQPKSGPPLHIHHQQHETIYFMKGRYKVQVDDDVFRCEPGGFVHIPIGARHAFVNVSDQPGECIVTFSPGATDKFFEEFAPVVRRGQPDPATIGPVFAKHGWELVGPPLSAD
jgi:quercetin dioxygenase-like cupin family protein